MYQNEFSRSSESLWKNRSKPSLAKGVFTNLTREKSYETNLHRYYFCAFVDFKVLARKR